LLEARIYLPASPVTPFWYFQYVGRKEALLSFAPPSHVFYFGIPCALVELMERDLRIGEKSHPHLRGRDKGDPLACFADHVVVVGILIVGYKPHIHE
jgi:hypothetical protein